MLEVNQNRYRISTNFTLLKVGLSIGLLSLIINMVREIRSDTFNQKAMIGLSFGIIALTYLFYFVSTRKRVDYDDIEQTLYIVDTKNRTEIEVPVENIDKIYLSAYCGKGNSSYVIVYKDVHNQSQKVRIVPILFDNSMNTIKTDTKIKNPNVIIRNWTIGWNELFE